MHVQIEYHDLDTGTTLKFLDFMITTFITLNMRSSHKLKGYELNLGIEMTGSEFPGPF